MSRHTRKGRNPGPVDEWLDTLGYYRKNVAYDETCLFRAVSEQMYACQLFHEKMRKECITYARNHYYEAFTHLKGTQGEWETHLERLGNHMAVCGLIEMHIISETYQKGILLFDGTTRCMEEITTKRFDSFLLLCHMGEDHYDVVYKRSYIEDAGFCQSIAYTILYENVFGIPKVSSIVQAMLYQKQPSPPAITEDKNNNREDEDDEEIEQELKNAFDAFKLKEDNADLDLMFKTNLTPFPFKIAKALDPTIYRNIEYDTWTEIRKEMRLGDWYYGDNNLIQGSGCVLRNGGEELHCYIQEIKKNENRCTVYITSKAEKRTVRLSDLEPEVDAKPWPMPYRFSKNLLLNIPKLELPDRKLGRKKKDKKAKINAEVEVQNDVQEAAAAVNVYEGAPLQMQNEESLIEQQPPPPVTYEETTWETNDSSEIWSPTPTADLAFNAKTSGDLYQGQRYFYPNEGYPSRYNVWTNGEYVAPLPPPDQTVPQSPQCNEVPQTPDTINFYFSDGSTYSPAYYSPAIEPQYIAPTQSMEMYPQVYPAPPPGTPIIYAQTDMSEVMVPSPHIAIPTPHIAIQSPHIAMYSPYEVPYVQASPFIYPATPPAPWYPSGLNSQGFIFPTTSQTIRAPTTFQ